ncbi:MAG: NAD(P)-dependent oxidoreductase [Candidatus Eremiobacteraeota bacterium]|nr:NAD(P)-dependent oxidoreductase [Candidatus Eremiobacteraeota bacterium]
MNVLNKQSKIGIVGLGRMGAGMASRLFEQGWNVEVLLDRDPAAANLLAEEVGGVIAATLADVAELADAIITVVSDDRAMRAIFATDGADTLLANPKGKLFINCATVSPGVHVELERLCQERGAQAIEACMAGSIPQAQTGTLMLMCGGSQEAFERARPLLDVLGSNVLYVGAAGKAAQVKALVNMVMNINTAGLAEGLGLAEALGLDLELVRAVFGETGAASRVLVTDGADMQARDHEPYFSAAHAAKDSNIALQLAQDVQLDLPLARAAASQYDRMVSSGLGELDKSGISELTFKSRAKS